MKRLNRCVLFAIDLQNCFGHPGGGLYVKGSEKIIEPANKLLEFFRNNGLLIAFSADWHPPDSDHFKKWPVHGVAETWDAEFLGGIIGVYSYLFRKGTEKSEDGYDPFEGRTAGHFTPQEVFTQDEIDTVIFFGIATDYCVKAGVLTSRRLGYKTYVVLDACAAVNVNPDDEQKAIEEMKMAGAAITTVEEVINGNF